MFNKKIDDIRNWINGDEGQIRQWPNEKFQKGNYSQSNILKTKDWATRPTPNRGELRCSEGESIPASLAALIVLLLFKKLFVWSLPYLPFVSIYPISYVINFFVKHYTCSFLVIYCSDKLLESQWEHIALHSLLIYLYTIVKKSLKIPKEGNQNSYIEEEKPYSLPLKKITHYHKNKLQTSKVL
jgi:hypothetical protein